MEDKSNYYLKIIAIRCINSLLILFFASIFLYSVTAHSQKNHIDQNDLRNALPSASELPAGVVNRLNEYEPDYSGSDNLNIRVVKSWRAYLSPEPAGDSIWGCNIAWYHPGYGPFETAEAYIEHRSRTIGRYGTPWLPYNELPGGLINETYWDSEGNSFIYCEILFWKSPYCVGEVMIAAQIDKNIPNNPASPPAATFYSRDSYAKAFIRTEAERLAKLIYSRLPDADGYLSVPQSFAERHPVVTTAGLILGVAAGGIVLGFAAAGGATVLATGTSGIALTGVLINLPLVGSIFARLFTSQRYIRFIAPKIVPLSALTDAALEKARAFRDLLYKVSEKAAEEFSKQAKIASDVLLDDSLGPHLEETGFEEVTFSNYPPYNPQLNHSYANAKKELDAFKQAYSSADPAQLQKSIASFQAEIDKAYQIMDNARLEQLREALETHIKYANSKYSNAD
jgi:hypothetical protein